MENRWNTPFKNLKLIMEKLSYFFKYFLKYKIYLQMKNFHDPWL